MRREFFAEFLGTFVLMVFGLGVNAQVFLGDETFGNFFSVNLGWGVAVMLGVYTAGRITGGHLNPAVTIAMFVRGSLGISKVAPYIAAQFLAAFVASAVVFGVYSEQLAAYESSLQIPDGVAHHVETSGIFATYPRKYDNGVQLSNTTGLIDQVLGTAMLLLCVCAISDDRNLAPRSNLGPLVVGSVVLMVGMSFGSNCGYAINPARDLGPRMFTAVAGWGGAVFSTPNGFWWLAPVVGPIVGGIAGVVAYDQLLTRWRPQDEADEEVKA